MSGINTTCSQKSAATFDICFQMWVNSVKQMCNKGVAPYNRLVCAWLQAEATFQNCRNILRAFSTSLYCESNSNTRGNDLGHSNNGKDWIICSQAPKCVLASTWRRFRDYNGVGLRKLAIFDEDIRNSPCQSRNILARILQSGAASHIRTKQHRSGNLLLIIWFIDKKQKQPFVFYIALTR